MTARSKWKIGDVVPTDEVADELHQRTGMPEDVAKVALKICALLEPLSEHDGIVLLAKLLGACVAEVECQDCREAWVRVLTTELLPSEFNRAIQTPTEPSLAHTH
jgi:hypothetical protein